VPEIAAAAPPAADEPRPLPAAARDTRAAAPPPSETLPQEPEVSRTVRVQAGQLLEIPFRGAGWVYRGEAGLKRGIDFDSRKLDGGGQTFVFRPKESGTYSLVFFKRDFYNDYEINDAVTVIVAPPPAGEREAETRVRAELWPPPDFIPRSARAAYAPAGKADGVPPGSAARADMPPSESGAEPAAAASTATAVSTAAAGTAAAGGTGTAAAAQAGNSAAASAPATAAETPAPAAADGGGGRGLDALLQDAEAAYEAGNIAHALEGLARIERENPEPDDRMLYLRGKAYEAPGALRNIKNSIGAYTALTRNFPESPYYSEAEKRIAYLNKYYFNIR
jgi:hypothetical protein